MPYKFKPLFYLLIYLFALPAGAHASAMKAILELKVPPEGVVIEIVSDDEDALEWALPKAENAIQQLRQRFPSLNIAIVTHGVEMFAMLKSERNSYHEVHQGVQSLVEDKNVELHVCGTYAGWQGQADEDFPGYVNVAAAGPAQINDYMALGYQLIVISDEDD
jgi:intracellular sulfur oxidation DsrE/DsrF family protein